jgi:hypothetical protein
MVGRCVILALFLLTAPPAVQAQQAGLIWGIDFLVIARNPGVEAVVRRRLGELGYAEGAMP